MKRIRWTLVAGAALLLLGIVTRMTLQDAPPVFDTVDEAALFILTEHNPDSIARNVELGGFIYRTRDGGFSSTKVIEGQFGNLYFPPPKDLVPEGLSAVATWHTHGAEEPGVVSETFSPQDIRMNEKFELDGYLATPRGQLKHHQPGNPNIRELGQMD